MPAHRVGLIGPRFNQEGVISTPRELVHLISDIASEKKANEALILDLGEKVSYCDYFFICHGTNRRQVRAIAEHVLETMKTEHDLAPLSVEGFDAARWVLLDYGDIVVHVFDEPMRGFYDLESLWADSVRVEGRDLVPERVYSTAG